MENGLKCPVFFPEERRRFLREGLESFSDRTGVFFGKYWSTLRRGLGIAREAIGGI